MSKKKWDWLKGAKDAELRAELKLVDEDDEIRVDSDESKAIEQIVYRSALSKLTPEQRSIASAIIKRYRR